MYVAELFTGGLPPAELAKRSQWVKDAKGKDTRTICRYSGCITPVSGYHRDANGDQESLCRRHYSEVNEPIKISKDGMSRRSSTCKQGHNLQEVGMKKGRCAQCQQEYDRARWERESETKRKSPYPLKAYVVLHALADLMRVRGLNPWSLGKEVEIPSRSLSGYAQDGVGCPPDRAKRIADYLGVSVEELTSQSQEVAM